MSKSAPVERVPSSWAIPQWPSTVYPGNSGRGRYLCRAFKDELVEAGALVRVGRDLVVIGQNYASWISRKGSAVAGFAIAPNKAKEQRVA